ncbi:hypothetical protein BDV36DRAFT_282212 [Aspergillus pseudocaelatus]|uniref:FAD linked oxidase N-terminal domain-containing protein n=1 Tax=Aspergillus pseudocaelatus TaxID=1825620 RepID=A0ABQ6WR41_9EURO|nr:hypothetical protein BDV36DRAFT_282212 [Aspergillus pseudocaelatus]
MTVEHDLIDRTKDALILLEPLIKQLDSDDIITPAAEDYARYSTTFSAERDLSPAVVFAPSSTQSLAKIVGFLYNSGLDFNFKAFEYDPVKKLASIGVGATWGEVAESMRDADAQFSVAVARTPSVGVGGSILHGGYSWMTGEFGCISDPVNLVDAEVVKYDGTIVMAADDPSLLWALRGSGGGFGSFMTKVVLRAHYYPTDIWTGMILVPRQELKGIAQHIVEFISRQQHPKISFMIYSVRHRLLHTILSEYDLRYISSDMIAIHVYDACGERHGREAFSWALEIPGAIDRTSVVDMKGVLDMQQNAALLRGTMKSFRAVSMGVSHLKEDTIVRALNWQEEIRSIDEAVYDRTMIIFEFFVLSPPIGGQAEVAWPRRLNDKHYLLVLTGSPGDGTGGQDRKADEVAVKAAEEIFGKSNQDYIILPAGLDELHDPKKTYGMHWEKLIDLRKEYDPKLRFKALVNP